MPVKISDRTATFGSSDIYATHDSNRGALGIHVVNSTSERNLIPLDRRKGTYDSDGASATPKPMLVAVRVGSDLTIYWLKNEPGTDTTTDGDWETYTATSADPFQGFFIPNSSTLVNGTGVKGNYWIASVSGTFNGETYAQYDKSIYDGAVWKKVGGGSVVADWNTMINKPSSFTPVTHTHTIDDISELDNELLNRVNWNQVVSTISNDDLSVPTADSVYRYSYSKSDVDTKFSNLATYGIKYSWTTQSSQNSQTGQIVGDLGLRQDENKVYKWSGTAWTFFFSVANVGTNLTETITVSSGITGLGISAGQSIVLGTSFTEALKRILTKITYPTYSPVSASISSDTVIVEIGSTVTPLISCSYSVGDSSGVISYKVNRGTTNVLDTTTVQSYTDSSQSIGSTPLSYTSIVKFGQGVIKNDNDTPPKPYPTGRIEETTITTNTVFITGYRNLFYDCSKASSTSSDIRALVNKSLNPADGTQFTISIPAGATSVEFAYPDTLRAVTKVLDNGSNLDIKSSFTKTTVSVEGANSYTAIDYKVYRFQPVASYSQDVTYTITI